MHAGERQHVIADADTNIWCVNAVPDAEPDPEPEADPGLDLGAFAPKPLDRGLSCSGGGIPTIALPADGTAADAAGAGAGSGAVAGARSREGGLR